MEVKPERTLVLIKPDAVERGLIGEIVQRFEKRGLKIIGMKLVKASRETAGRHYTEDPDWLLSIGQKARKSFEEKGIEVKETDKQIGERVRTLLIGYVESGPIVAMVIEGPHAIETVRKIVGPTEPRTAPPGTIRGDYSIDSYLLSDSTERPVKNLIHASGNEREAVSEIKVWFSENELHSYERSEEKAAFFKTWK